MLLAINCNNTNIKFGVVDGDRILITRQAYPPKELPSHLVVIGFGLLVVFGPRLSTRLRYRVRGL